MELLCKYWQDDWAVIRLVDTLDRFRKHPASSTRTGRVWEKIKAELKNKHVPLPEDLQVRVPRGTPKEAHRACLDRCSPRRRREETSHHPASSGYGQGREL